MGDRETLKDVSTADLAAEAVRRLRAAGGQMVVNGHLFVLDGNKILKSRLPVQVDPETGRVKLTKG